MCSYQSISDANYGNNLSENWEKNLWANVLSPSSNTSSTSTYHSQVSDAANQIYSEKNVIPSSQDHQMQITSAYQNEESSSSPVISPAWVDATFEIPQSCTNMSTYFSTFNPSSQFENVLTHDGPVRNISNAKTQNSFCNRKMPQARINLVPAGNGNFKAIVKRKRKRTVFTTEQLQVLEEVYSRKPYVTRDERQILVHQLQVNDKSVKIWFQNRRLKNKRGDDQEIQDDNQCSIFDRIDTVESKIKERTDEYGYVTLDDKIMNDLVNVIDDYFTNNASPVETKRDIDNSPIYEPISPASTSENSCDENGAAWQHYETNDIIQELMDIESIITV